MDFIYPDINPNIKLRKNAASYEKGKNPQKTELEKMINFLFHKFFFYF